MSHSKLEKLWEGIKPLRHLKWMDLSSSVNLKMLKVGGSSHQHQLAIS
ncbi:unnamed protein product [Arabidopsis halleri]